MKINDIMYEQLIYIQKNETKRTWYNPINTFDILVDLELVEFVRTYKYDDVYKTYKLTPKGLETIVDYEPMYKKNQEKILAEKRRLEKEERKLDKQMQDDIVESVPEEMKAQVKLLLFALSKDVDKKTAIKEVNKFSKGAKKVIGNVAVMFLQQALMSYIEYKFFE